MVGWERTEKQNTSQDAQCVKRCLDRLSKTTSQPVVTQTHSLNHPINHPIFRGMTDGMAYFLLSNKKYYKHIIKKTKPVVGGMGGVLAWPCLTLYHWLSKKLVLI